MKRVLSILIILGALASSVYLFYQYTNYENSKKDRNNSITELNNEKENLLNEEKELQEKINQIKEDNKDKIMEYEKWQKDVEEVNSYIQ